MRETRHSCSSSSRNKKRRTETDNDDDRHRGQIHRELLQHEKISLIPSRDARFALQLERLKRHAVTPNRDAVANPKTGTAATGRSSVGKHEKRAAVVAMHDDFSSFLPEQFSLIPSHNTHFARKLQRMKSRKGQISTKSQNTQLLPIVVNHTVQTTNEVDMTEEKSMTRDCLDDCARRDCEIVDSEPSMDDEKDDPFFQVPQLPANLLLEHIACFISDRITWNAIATLNREVYRLNKRLAEESNNSINSYSSDDGATNKVCHETNHRYHLYRPWPRIRWRVASGRRAWTVHFGLDYLCCGTDQGNILVWKVHETGSAHSLLWQGKNPSGLPATLASGPFGCGRINSVKCHGDWIVSAGDDMAATVWNVKTWSREAILRGHTSSITSVSVLDMTSSSTTVSSCQSMPGMLVVTGSQDGDIRLYKLFCQGNRVVSTHAVATLVNAHQGAILSVAMYHDKERRGRGVRLLSGGTDERLRQWNLDDAFFATKNDAITVDEKALPSSTTLSNYGIRIYNRQYSQCIFKFEGELRSIAVGPNQQHVAAAFGNIIVHQGTSKKEDRYHNGNHWTILKGHTSNVRCIDFSPNGEVLASACSDGTIRLWSLQDGTWKRKWKAHNGFMVCSLAFSLDGTSLLSTGSDGTIAIEQLY